MKLLFLNNKLALCFPTKKGSLFTISIIKWRKWMANIPKKYFYRINVL